MITTNSNVFGRRVSALVKELEYVSTQSFLRGLSLGQRADEALNYLLSIFPRSEDGKSDLNEFGEHLYSGWKSSYFVEGAALGFQLKHDLDKDKRAKVILAALDTGSKAFNFQPQEATHFIGNLRTAKGNLGRKSSWVTLSPNEVYHHDAREGVEYTSRTILFIESQIVPEVKQDVSYKVLQRLKRI